MSFGSPTALTPPAETFAKKTEKPEKVCGGREVDGSTSRSRDAGGSGVEVDRDPVALAAGVAHYFDNYLSTIQEATEQLQLRLDMSDPLCNTASVIAHGTQLCMEVTRRLQAFTRQRVFLAQPTDVNAMLRNFRRRIGSSRRA